MGLLCEYEISHAGCCLLLWLWAAQIFFCKIVEHQTEVWASGKAEYTNTGGATNFFFRVRTELDEHKQVKQALYGKLIGPIEVQLHYVKTGKLNFTYYLNPTPLDRNMEFDPKKNLFKNLPSLQRVGKP